MAFGKRVQHETIVMQHNAGIGQEVFDFKPGDRVMTVDGIAGKVVAMNSGPYAGTEDYEVVLDNNMGGGTYRSNQLSKVSPTTAVLHEATEVTASIPVEAITSHTADIDYPELGSILYERLPNENVRLAANKDNTAKESPDDSDDPGERMDQDEDDEETSNTDENTDTKAAEEPADEAGKDEDDAGPPDIDQEKENNAPDVAPPSACSFCGADEFEDPQMTGRGVRMRCAQCGGTMKSWGGQWEPEFPNSPENHASGQSDWSQGGAAGVANAPGANFKTTSLDVEAGIVNWIVDKIYDEIELKKQHPLLDKEWAWNQNFEGMPHYDENIAQNHALGPVQVEGHPLTIHAALDDYDREWNFHFTATWRDVQDKATRIRREGGVKILNASKLFVVGEVKGDTAVYESELNYIPGTKKVAHWACGCKWASYTWGRSPQYKRFEGRLCSHALALQYEANARGMFGTEVQPDTSRPSWQKQHHPVQVQYQRPTTRSEEKELRRRVVPPGNMKRTFSSMFSHRSNPYFEQGVLDGTDWAKGLDSPGHSPVGEAMDRLGEMAVSDPKNSGHYINGFRAGHDDHFGVSRPKKLPWFAAVLDTDRVYESPELLDLYHPPVFASVQKMAEEGEPTENIIEMLASFDVSRDSAKGMLFEALISRDGDEYETPDGDRFNHGEKKDTEDWDDPEYVRANQRDLSDHDDDKYGDIHKLKHHRTNDAREHAVHWGWGLPEGIAIENCPQCNGSGCGHCGGLGQIPSDQTSMSLTNTTPDQTDDAGDVASGLATNGALMQSLNMLHEADYSSADPLAGVDSQTYYSPTNHSNSKNPASTGWATSQDPGDWGQSIITNNFGLTTDSALDAPTSVAGVALRAKDTGRLLMLQRGNEDENDPARGTWEFPGGHHEDGDQTSLHAAVREWEEEVGHPFPSGGSVVHTWRSGPYRGHVVEIPSEDAIDFSKGRQIDNPDGDRHEQAAWWDAAHAKKNPALRKELRSAPWEQISKASAYLTVDDVRAAAAEAGIHTQEEAREALRQRVEWQNQYFATLDNPLRDEADDEIDELLPKYKQLLAHPDYHDRGSAGYRVRRDLAPIAMRLRELQRQKRERQNSQHSATLLDDPDAHGALPYTEGGDDVLAGQTGGSSGDSDLPHATDDALHTDLTGDQTINSLHQAFLNTPAAQKMAAEIGLSKAAMKDFSYGEQQDLINEGQGVRARNFSDLKIAGTHYENLEDEDGDLFI